MLQISEKTNKHDQAKRGKTWREQKSWLPVVDRESMVIIPNVIASL